MRAAIAAAPDGVYHGEDVIDNDWVAGGPVHVRVAVTIDGDEVAIAETPRVKVGSEPGTGGS